MGVLYLELDFKDGEVSGGIDGGHLQDLSAVFEAYQRDTGRVLHHRIPDIQVTNFR